MGLDNGGGANQQDIPCQDIVLSENLFDSGGGRMTSGYSPFNTRRPGATVKAFDSALHKGVCDGAILRAPLNAAHPENAIEPFSWGYRNGYAIRFPPDEHPLAGGILVGEDGADERGSRPSNNAPDNLQLGRQNPTALRTITGGPTGTGSCRRPRRYSIRSAGQTTMCAQPHSRGRHALRPLWRRTTSPSAMSLPVRLSNHRASGHRGSGLFVHRDRLRARCFCRWAGSAGSGAVHARGDFGFSAPNATAPAPEVGHEVKLVNFNQLPDSPLALKIQRFAFNNTGDQAFITDKVNGFNRPTQVRFGPDGCAYVVDYGAGARP